MEEYNKEATNRKLLPAEFQSLVEMPAGKPGVAWADFNGRHPVTAQFRNDVRNGAPDFADPATWPRANAYWDVKPADDKSVVLNAYADADGRPILVERATARAR